MQVFTCGAAGCGQLLDGSQEDRSTPVLAPGLRVQRIEAGGTFTLAQVEEGLVCWSPAPVALGVFPVTQIACGWSHALLLGEGRVWTFGEGRHGQLGLGGVTKAPIPTVLRLPEQTKFVACGFRTSFTVTADEGQVYCFGDNKKDQLGLSSHSSYSVPTLHPSLRDVRILASGHRHTAAVIQCQVYMWGQNTHGQFGQSMPSATSEPVPVALPELQIAQVKCGWFHTGLLTHSGELYLAGKGDFGQQGAGQFDDCSHFHLVLTQVEVLASGSEHLLALCSGQAFCWGWNEHGNLGLGDCLNRPSPHPVALPSLKTVAAAAAVSYFCA